MTIAAKTAKISGCKSFVFNILLYFMNIMIFPVQHIPLIFYYEQEDLS